MKSRARTARMFVPRNSMSNSRSLGEMCDGIGSGTPVSSIAMVAGVARRNSSPAWQRWWQRTDCGKVESSGLGFLKRNWTPRTLNFWWKPVTWDLYLCDLRITSLGRDQFLSPWWSPKPSLQEKSRRGCCRLLVTFFAALVKAFGRHRAKVPDLPWSSSGHGRYHFGMENFWGSPMLRNIHFFMSVCHVGNGN